MRRKAHSVCPQQRAPSYLKSYRILTIGLCHRSPVAFKPKTSPIARGSVTDRPWITFDIHT